MPSTAINVPGAASVSSGPAPTTAGIPTGPQQDGAVRGGAAVRQHHGGGPRGIERGRLGGGQVGGDQHAIDVRERARHATEQAHHPVAHVAHVGCARPHVLVGSSGELGLHRGQAVRPGPRRACSVVDHPARAVEQVWVVEQQQVGVEDRGLRHPDLGRGAIPDREEVHAGLVKRLLQSFLAVLRGGGFLVGNADRRLAQRLNPSDADPG